MPSIKTVPTTVFEYEDHDGLPRTVTFEMCERDLLTLVKLICNSQMHWENRGWVNRHPMRLHTIILLRSLNPLLSISAAKAFVDWAYSSYDQFGAPFGVSSENKGNDDIPY